MIFQNALLTPPIMRVYKGFVEKAKIRLWMEI